MTPDNATEVEQVADAIRRYGLVTPARMLLEACEPLDIIGCQVALFLHTLAPQGSLYRLTSVFETPENWQQLRRLLKQQDY